ncbi:hypothetical protein [Paenibacillus sp. CF384]|uniref:hypothetical protein n=1 Tax=Paenibacillus sp. CF384 TaxID=1884382 RepID=UPI00089A45B4|nr:hypothetical protein [Paenibacillus sp. CF384]SDW21352.1 hypothetical protein SAMN05518855_1001678 [Paenibacillus sp. CF384]
MRRVHVVLLSVMLLLVLVGCQNSYSAAIQVAKEYAKTQYEVEDYTNVTFPSSIQIKERELSSLITDDFIPASRRGTQSRVIELPLQVAQAEQSTISVEKVHLIPSSKDDIKNESNKFFRYDMTLVVTNGQEESKNVHINGVLTMQKVNNEWKVSYDWNRSEKDLVKLLTRPL